MNVEETEEVLRTELDCFEQLFGVSKGEIIWLGGVLTVTYRPTEEQLIMMWYE